MNFHINKNSNLPYLRLALIKDGRYDWSNFHEKIQNAEIKFSMYDADSGIQRICNKDASCELKDSGDCDEEYFIVYKWEDRDTLKPGTYIGKFKITFLDTGDKLIVPIREELFIHVLEGTIKK